MNRSTCVCVRFLFADMLHVIHNIFSELFDIYLKDSQGFPEFLQIFIMHRFACVSVFHICRYVNTCFKKLYFLSKSINNRRCRVKLLTTPELCSNIHHVRGKFIRVLQSEFINGDCLIEGTVEYLFLI